MTQSQILHGDCLDVMPTLATESIDAIVTDPPYGLGFMGKSWDKGVPGFAYWTEALRVLKPGGHLLAFGGTRTYHRMACAVEDAGFDIRDSLIWLYGSGFPKSHNLDGEWEGWGTALKPGHEPIVCARKPLVGTVAANVEQFGVGALNIDACRIPTEDILTGSGSPPLKYSGGNHRPFHDNAEARGCNQHSSGRWPANVILSDEAAEELDRQSGIIQNGGQNFTSAGSPGMFGVGARLGTGGTKFAGDSGGASRFFYCAKPDRAERNEGLSGGVLPAVNNGARPRDTEHADWPARNGNHHPTVKPLSLMRWLCRLVTPPGGVILDPFAGSGTTGVAAIDEGFQFIGIEREAEYLPIIEARLRYASRQERMVL